MFSRCASRTAAIGNAFSTDSYRFGEWSFQNQRPQSLMRGCGRCSASHLTTLALLMILGVFCIETNVSASTVSEDYWQSQSRHISHPWKRQAEEESLKQQGRSDVVLEYTASAEPRPTPVQSPSQMKVRYLRSMLSAYTPAVLTTADTADSEGKSSDDPTQEGMQLDNRNARNTQPLRPLTFQTQEHESNRVEFT